MIHRMFWRSAAALAWVWLCCSMGSPAFAVGGYHSGGASVTSDNGATVRFVAGGSALVQRALADLGRGNFTGIRAPWCAFSVSAWLEAIGKPRLPNGLASSGLAYGPHVNSPRAGDLPASAGRRAGGGQAQPAGGRAGDLTALAGPASAATRRHTDTQSAKAISQ